MKKKRLRKIKRKRQVKNTFKLIKQTLEKH